MKKIPIEAHLKGKDAHKRLQKSLGHFSPKEVKMGVKDEHEHTSSDDVAGAIALTHLIKDSDYYGRMKKAHIESIDVFSFNFHDILESDDDVPLALSVKPNYDPVKPKEPSKAPKKQTRTIAALSTALGVSTAPTSGAPKEPVHAPTSRVPKVKAAVSPELFGSEREYYQQQTAHALKQRDNFAKGVPALFLPQPGGRPRDTDPTKRRTQLQASGERVSGNREGHPTQTTSLPDHSPEKYSDQAIANKVELRTLSNKMKSGWKKQERDAK